MILEKGGKRRRASNPVLIVKLMAMGFKECFSHHIYFLPPMESTEDQTAFNPDEKSLDKMTKAELETAALYYGVDIAKCRNNQERIETIRAVTQEEEAAEEVE